MSSYDDGANRRLPGFEPATPRSTAARPFLSATKCIELSARYCAYICTLSFLSFDDDLLLPCPCDAHVLPCLGLLTLTCSPALPF
eukprot:scaffold33194_cov30-Phaeocystis_antarctica.AAC.1